MTEKSAAMTEKSAAMTEIKLPTTHLPSLILTANAYFCLKSVGYTKSELLRHHIFLQCGTNHAALFIVGSPDG